MANEIDTIKDANGVEHPLRDVTKQPILTPGNNITIDANNEISATDTTYESKAAASGGTAESLCTTGEKYIWNNKQDSLLGNNISSGDLNDYTTIGNYYISNKAVINKPVNELGFLEVIRKDTSSSAGKLQRYTAVHGTDGLLGVYERIFISGDWEKDANDNYIWHEIPLEDDITDLQGQIDNLGTILSSSPSDTTVTTLTSYFIFANATEIGSLMLTKGKWVIFVAIRLNTGNKTPYCASGVLPTMYAALSTSQSSFAWSVGGSSYVGSDMKVMNTHSSSSSQTLTYMQLRQYANCSSNTTIYVRLAHDAHYAKSSGGAIILDDISATVSTRIIAIKVG